MKNIVKVASCLLISTLALASCGQAPDSGGTGSGDAKKSDFQACMVTDMGGVDDRSFNAAAWKGLQDAKSEAGIKVKYVESKGQNDYAPNVQQMVDDKSCNMIVTVGFMLGDATKAAAEKNPDRHFAIVDYAYDQPIKNIQPLVFDTAQAGFLAGYVSAASSKSGTVATFGGINLPTVTVFMDGFWDGVQYYNKAKNKQVKVLGWDKTTKTGSFTGDFENQQNGQNLTQTFASQGADVVMPVAGPVGLGAAKAAQDSGGKVMIVGVDTDWYVSAPQYKSVVLTSVVKGMDVAVKQSALDSANGKFSNTPLPAVTGPMST